MIEIGSATAEGKERVVVVHRSDINGGMISVHSVGRHQGSLE
jgi:hypothetical protein